MPRENGSRGYLGIVADQLGLVGVLAALVVAFGLTTPNFMTAAKFETIANQIPAVVLVSVGMTYVLIIAGIDLSVGSVLALSGVVIGKLMTADHPASIGVAVLAGLGAGILCGLLNGVVTVAWGIPSFVVTLGMMEIARGGAHWVSGSRTAYIGGKVAGIAEASFLNLSLPFWVAMGVVGLGQFVLSRTVFGRYVVAVGTNEEATRLSGIATKPVKAAVFVLAGLLAAMGAVVDVSRSESADPNARNGLELQAIAAVVIGGTSLMGGRGNVVNSLLGVAIVAVLSAGLAARGVSDEMKRVITGAVIILAVIIDYYRGKWGTKR